MTSCFKSVLSLLVLAALCSVSTAHIEVSNPPPRGSRFHPSWTGPIDYDIMAPLGPGKPFPCQGKPAGNVVRTLSPGTSLSVNFIVGANHDGGHCQFAMSYDNGSTWVVLSTVVRNCFRNNEANYAVPLPASLPPCERCIFAWTWINAMGNREFYMNCVDVKVTGNGNGIAGPQLFVANLPGYPIIPEFFGDRPDYRHYLDSRPIITVSGSGTASSTTTTTTTQTPSSTTTRTTTQTPSTTTTTTRTTTQSTSSTTTRTTSSTTSMVFRTKDPVPTHLLPML